MNQVYAVGIDIGGTRLRIGLVNQHLEIEDSVVTREHAHLSPPELVDFIRQNLLSLLERHRSARILGVGVGYPGPISCGTGSTFSYSNLRDNQWNRIPLKTMIEQRLGFPVLLDNDANLAGLAEVRLGAGRDFQHVVYLTVSTGTGGAIFIDRRLYRGFLGGAGEFGHMVVNLHGVKCKCGNTGCLMSFLSGLGLERLIKQAPSCREILADHEPGADCVKKLMELFRCKHPIAAEMTQPLLQYLAAAFLNIIHLLNPELIVVGGALGKTLMTLFLDEVRENLRLNLPDELVDTTTIRTAELGDHNGVLGGAILVFERLAPIPLSGLNPGT